MDDKERFKQGMAVRRAVLGDEWVDRAQAKRNSFTAEFQDFITRYAWGEVWSRPGLDRRSRSLMTMAMMIWMMMTMMHHLQRKNLRQRKKVLMTTMMMTK